MYEHEKKTIAARAFQPHKTGKGLARIDFGGAVISPVLDAGSFKMTSGSGVWPLVLLLAACGGGGGGFTSKPVIVAAIPPVKKTPMPASPDTDVPDADVPDADVPDTDVPDADVPDTDVPDADVPDADVPDTDVLTESPFSDVMIPIERVPVISGRRLDTLTITPVWRGLNNNIALERTGYWDVYNQDGGNSLTLKIRFGDGNEMVVARLERDDAQSAYRLDTSTGAPALNTKFAGKYGYLQVTQLTSKDVVVGDSKVRLAWKYVLFGETGTGAPVNRLKPSESDTEQIGFTAQNGVNMAKSDDKTITFTLQGKNDRPFIVESDPDAKTLAEEFPIVTPDDGVIPNWPWWEQDNIVELTAYPTIKEFQVDRNNGLVWRFVPVDVDGGYFQPTADGTPRDYGNIADFVARYIRFTSELSQSERSTHRYFEVVQAVDADGRPRFVTMPDGSADRLPILDLRLKSDLPSETIPFQSFTLILKGDGVDFSTYNVTQTFAVSQREIYGRDGLSDVFRISSVGMSKENVPIFVNFEDGRDLIDMGSRDTVWWKLSDDGNSTILFAAADGSNEKVLAIMRGFVANRYNLTEADFRFDYPVLGISVNPVSHDSTSAGSQGTIGQRDDPEFFDYTIPMVNESLTHMSNEFI